MNDRIVPNSIDAEACVLGSMILDPVAISIVTSLGVEAEHFHRPAHQIIFSRLCKMDTEAKQIDLVSMKAEFTRAKQLEAIGGMDYLVALIEGVPGISNVKYYAGIVLEMATRRSLISHGKKIIEMAYDSTDHADEIVSKAQDGLFSLMKSDDTSLSGSGYSGALAAIETVVRRKEGTDASILPTPFYTINQAAGGFERGDYVAIGGVTGTGKTCIMLHIASFYAEMGLNVLYFSSEMSAEKLASRVLHAGACVNAQWSRTGNQTGRGVQKLREEAERTKGHNIEYVFGASTEVQVHQKVNAMRRKWGSVDIVLVDYITAMGMDPKVKGLREQATQYSQTLNSIAKESNLVMIVAAQFNRSAHTENRKPTMTDFKETGQIEQDASFVLLIHDMKDDQTCNEHFYTYADGSIRYAQYSVIGLCAPKVRDGQATSWPREGQLVSTKFSSVQRFYKQMTRFEESFKEAAYAPEPLPY